jgi:hypothetical protein
MQLNVCTDPVQQLLYQLGWQQGQPHYTTRIREIYSHSLC